MRWVTGVRIRRAQELLETTDHGVDRIAHLIGFTSPGPFRARFKHLTGVAPHVYRTTFRARRSSAPGDERPRPSPRRS